LTTIPKGDKNLGLQRDKCAISLSFVLTTKDSSLFNLGCSASPWPFFQGMAEEKARVQFFPQKLA
jgi:hypothetical protein